MTSTISLCCITAGPSHRVAAIFARYRPHVDEIVCAVDARLSESELEPIRAIADKVLRCEMREDFLQEHYRPWLYAQCHGDWIASTDSDELPSQALLDALPDLTSRLDISTYAMTCRWLFPDSHSYLDEYPWEPAWKLVLVRNDVSSLYIRSGVHEGVVMVPPFRYVDLPVYHLDCLLTSYEQRKEKAQFYEGLSGVQLMEDGRSISAVYYLPEDHSRFSQRRLPEIDAAAVKRVLEADERGDRVFDRSPASQPLFDGISSYDEIISYRSESPFRLSGYRANLALRERSRTPMRSLSPMAPGESRPILVDVRNDSDTTWRREGRNEVRLASRWFSRIADMRGELVLEGSRWDFNADVQPHDCLVQPLEITAPQFEGDYFVSIDLVHEGVRWFGAEVVIPVVVTRSR